jgi:hypothetical protein
MNKTTGRLRSVWATGERAGKPHRTKVGVACEMEDGTLLVRLDAVPLAGKLVVSEWSSAEEAAVTEVSS